MHDRRQRLLATGSTVFNGAVVGAGAEVRINGVVHLKKILQVGAVVPIDWVAVGDPAQILPPKDHERICSLQEPLNFPRTVFGVERAEPATMMPEIMRRYANALEEHRNDEVLES
jgi:carbonic anhydrase/acetyltransferase-like protein (isoleucine patch superfamily)